MNSHPERSDSSQKMYTNMHVKQEYFELINSNQKTLEIRPEYQKMKAITVGQQIRFLNKDGEACTRYVVRTAYYDSFEDFEVNEDLERVHPTKSREEIIQEGRALIGDAVRELGMRVFELSENKPNIHH